MKARQWLLRRNRATRLVFLSLALGLVGALGAQAFLWMLRLAERLLLTGISGYFFLTAEQAFRGPMPSWTETAYWLLPLALTLGGLLSGVLVYTWAPEAEGHGTDAAVRAFHLPGGLIRTRIPFIKSIASAVTIGSGGSAGREGPTAQIAAGIGSILGRVLELPEDERRTLLLVGMSAGLSAIFKSPLGTAIFGVEILYSSMAFEGGVLVFTIMGAAVAYAVTGMLEGWEPLFYLPGGGSFMHSLELLWYFLLGLVTGVVGALLPWAFYTVRDRFKSLHVPDHFKPAIGGALLGLIGMGLPQLLGGGYGWIQMAIDGKLAISLMLALAFGKILALSLTVSSGGSGGVFAPSLYVGAMLGAALAGLLQNVSPFSPDPTAFAVVGMSALFAGAARVPIAALIMVTEMTGGYQLIMPAMLAVAVSYLVQSELTRGSRYPSLYEAQVPLPVNSPVHHMTYYRAVADMLRQKKVSLDEDIVIQELTSRLAKGLPIALAGEKEWLFSAEVASGAEVAGQSLRALSLPSDILIVSLLREHEAILPHGDAVLLAGDRVLVAATEEAMKRFRPLLSPPSEERREPSSDAGSNR
jgi:CIC family chloride channel protein